MRIVVGLAVIAIAGCGKDSRAERCDKAHLQTAKQLDGFVDKASLSREGKQRFMAMCNKLSDEALTCLEDMDREPTARCIEIFTELAAAETPKLSIEWERMELDHGRITAQVPRGWEQDPSGGAFTAPGSDAFGRLARYQVASTCGGACDPQPAAEWARRFDESLQAGGREILRDEPIDDSGRLVVDVHENERGVVTRISLGRWSDGGEVYVVCQATLEKKVADHLAAIEQACRAMKVASFRSSHGN